MLPPGGPPSFAVPPSPPLAAPVDPDAPAPPPFTPESITAPVEADPDWPLELPEADPDASDPVAPPLATPLTAPELAPLAVPVDAPVDDVETGGELEQAAMSSSSAIARAAGPPSDRDSIWSMGIFEWSGTQKRCADCIIVRDNSLAHVEVARTSSLAPVR
jgi:hypothetical protein